MYALLPLFLPFSLPSSLSPLLIWIAFDEQSSAIKMSNGNGKGKVHAHTHAHVHVQTLIYALGTTITSFIPPACLCLTRR
jgi:hypothetical protein